MTFEYVESKDEAARIARAALPLAHKFDLPANPINYAVLYEFVAGQNPELCKAIETAMRVDTKPSNADFRHLYHAHITRTDEQAVEAVRQALSQLVDTAGAALVRMDGDSQSYTNQLRQCAEALSGVDSATQLRGVIETLRQQTETMQCASNGLREELQEAKRELAELRNEFKRVRQESLVDPLTGINNRRAFDLALDEAAKSHAEARVPMCLLLLDVDHFKRINDDFGHCVGDAVLKWFAKILRETVRGADTVARYGGEEFAVFLPQTQLSGARIVAENIRRRVSEQNLRVGQHQIGRVTCSLGVAAITTECDVARWLANADSAMYRAKHSGRDKVSIHGLQ